MNSGAEMLDREGMPAIAHAKKGGVYLEICEWSSLLRTFSTFKKSYKT